MRFVQGEPRFSLLAMLVSWLYGWYEKHLKRKMTFGEILLSFENYARVEQAWKDILAGKCYDS